MYEVFLKSWYQEIPNNIQEEIMFTGYFEEAFLFFNENANRYIENYPLIEIGIRIKNNEYDNRKKR